MVKKSLISCSADQLSMCARIGAPSLAALARVLNYWILAPLHILPYTHSSLHILPYNSKTKADIEKFS